MGSKSNGESLFQFCPGFRQVLVGGACWCLLLNPDLAAAWPVVQAQGRIFDCWFTPIIDEVQNAGARLFLPTGFVIPVLFVML